MSAGSPRRSHSQTRTPNGTTTVSPQQVTDPGILDSVAGFINEVATYNIPFDTKDQIQWAKFQYLDRETISENVEGDKVIPSTLILVLGYSTGIQVWAVPANGEAVELLSWRHGSVKVLQFLPQPSVGRRTLPLDIYAAKRPLMALCDATTPGPQHCALNFLSLRTGEQVKVIKFKNPILDVLANRNSIVVTFSERIAVFDALTLEDRLTVTTCYLSPGIYSNPVALGARWMAYAEQKLISRKRSSGGNEGEGVQSYTATMIHAAKSLGKGLRELGETVANSLSGNPTFKPGNIPGNTLITGNNGAEILQKGVVTVLDIENPILDKHIQCESIVAHFAAHTEAIVYLAFDPSGLLLLTADKRGHDFHLFRIHSHPGGPALAAVHHLYILHRGDTTARVQDMCFSPDSRWVGVSTLRGTTHVFPITPYGGNVGVRTHATPHVVNRMSRFHRSAGLPVEGRSNSPVSLFEAPINSNIPFNNPRLPPYPHPTVVHPLSQIRQPLFIPIGGNLPQRSHTGRPRLNSSSEDNIQIAIRLSCCFAPARAWFDNTTKSHDTTAVKQVKPVESLFVMSCQGTLLQYDLDPHHIPSIPKEKVCDETPIELTVHAKAQWNLQRQLHLNDVPLPISPQNLNLLPQNISIYKSSKPDHADDRWLSQVEIVTHAGPHRRLWMGPQFTFKTYTTTNGSSLSLNEAQTVDVNRSKPVNMPISTAYPILIESGSASSCEQSPKLLETYQQLSEETGGPGELQLKEDLADAMLESPGVRESGGRCVIVSMKPHTTSVAKVVNPLGTVVTVHSDEDTVAEIVEDSVIHENCDEALFRPVVAPPPYLFSENKSKKLNTTISVKPTVEHIKKIVEIENQKPSKIVEYSNPIVKPEPVNKITKNKLENKDVEVPKITESSITKKTKFKQKEKSADKTEKFVSRTDYNADKFAEKAEKSVEKLAKSSEKAERFAEKVEKSVEKLERSAEKREKSAEKVEKSVDKLERSAEKREKSAEKTEKSIEKLERSAEKREKSVEKAEKSVEKLERSADKREKFAEKAEKSIEKAEKSVHKAEKHIDKFGKSTEKAGKSAEQESNTKKNLFTNKCNGSTEEMPALKTLITTPDLMDTIPTFNFPIPIKTKNEESIDQEKFTFTPIFKKTADETNDNRSTITEHQTNKVPKTNCLESEEVMVSSEEEKSTTKKMRKPKTKLGVRLNKGKDFEKESSPTIEVSLPPHKKSWSSIVSTKPAELEVKLPPEIFDISDIETIESETSELPKKSYSTAAKQHLLEIDPNEDANITDLLVPEKIYSTEADLKTDNKSDDENKENGGSQNETTESDDSAKVIAMDTEEDNCQSEVTKGTQAADKNVKKKSKKKKR